LRDSFVQVHVDLFAGNDGRISEEISCESRGRAVSYGKEDKRNPIAFYTFANVVCDALISYIFSDEIIKQRLRWDVQFAGRPPSKPLRIMLSSLNVRQTNLRKMMKYCGTWLDEFMKIPRISNLF
jgi:hypothetical protein